MEEIILTNFDLIGFKVEEVNYSQKISSELSSRYRLMEGELLPVVFKN